MPKFASLSLVLSIALASLFAVPASAQGTTGSASTVVDTRARDTVGGTEKALIEEADLTPVEAANLWYFNGDYQSASSYCLKLLKKESGKSVNYPGDFDGVDAEGKPILKPTDADARVYINLGLCCLGLKQYDKAESWFNQAKKLLDKSQRPEPLAIADCWIGLAECHYMQGRSKQSLREYSEAISFYRQKLGRWHPETVPALEGLAGSHYIQGDYEKALPLYEQIARIDLIQHGPLHSRFAMSLNNLSEVYYKLSGCEKSRKMYEHATWIFKQNAADRLLKNVQCSSPEQLEIMKRRIKETVLGTKEVPDLAKFSCEALKADDFDPKQKTFTERAKDFDNWRLFRKNAEQTVFVAIDPRVEQKAMIICLHGLGLYSRSFEDFAHKITPFGYSVVALDVRGFGSFAMEKGLDKLDLHAGLDDLAASVELVKEHNPKLPLVILGESMGGALAMQLAAKRPDHVSALISAVPSGKRYKSAKTSFLVGLKLLEDKKKPIQIGKKVIEQSTADADVRAVWMNDPGNRLQLSAEELVRFQDFMRDTERRAKDIKQMPVIIFQGFKDHLVKPEGTIALYGALATPQKDLVLVGDSEHLIFEEGQAPEDIVRMLAGWLDTHIGSQKSKIATPATGPFTLPAQ